MYLVLKGASTNDSRIPAMSFFICVNCILVYEVPVPNADPSLSSNYILPDQKSMLSEQLLSRIESKAEKVPWSSVRIFD